jgi:hypothetical protein
MNGIQRSIARISGFDNEFRSLEGTISEQSRALESVSNENIMLSRHLEELEYLNIFDQMPGFDVESLPGAKKKQTIQRLRRLRHDNPLAKQAVKLSVRFTFCKGIQWVAKDEESDEVLSSFWKDPINQMVLTSHEAMKDRFDETLTDGEKFFVLFDSSAPPYVRMSEIPMEEITDIIYDPNNRFIPVYYKRVFLELVYDDEMGRYKARNGTGQPTTKYYRDFRVSDEDLLDIEGLDIPDSKIGEGKIFHRMINPVWTKNGRRGISELYASRQWFRVFREFMENRASINAAATSISFLRKTKGGPAAVASMSGKFGGMEVGENQESSDSEVRKLTKPVSAAVYDANEAVDLSWMKTDTGAVNAKEDGRGILMAAGAGVGTNIHYFGEGGDANLATAQAMELPMVKGYEDWQKFIENDFNGIFQYVIRVARGDDVEEEQQRVSWDFPPIISQDVVKYTTAWAQLFQQLAPGNIKVQEEAIRGALMTLDVPHIDKILPEIMAEQERMNAIKEDERQQRMANFGLQPGGPGGPKLLNEKNPDDEKPKKSDPGQRVTDGGIKTPQLPPQTVKSMKPLAASANGRKPE